MEEEDGDDDSDGEPKPKKKKSRAKAGDAEGEKKPRKPSKPVRFVLSPEHQLQGHSRTAVCMLTNSCLDDSSTSECLRCECFPRLQCKAHLQLLHLCGLPCHEHVSAAGRVMRWQSG